MTNGPESKPNGIEKEIIKDVLEEALQAARDGMADDFKKHLKSAEEKLNQSSLSPEEKKAIEQEIKNLRITWSTLNPNQKDIFTEDESLEEDQDEDEEEEDEKDEVLNQEIINSVEETLEDLREKIKDNDFDPNQKYKDDLSALEYLGVKIEQLNLLLKQAAQDPFKLHKVALYRRDLLKPAIKLKEELKERAENLNQTTLENERSVQKLTDFLNHFDRDRINGEDDLSAEQGDLESAIKDLENLDTINSAPLMDEDKNYLEDKYLKPARELLQKIVESEEFRKSTRDLRDLIDQVVDDDGKMRANLTSKTEQELNQLQTDLEDEKRKIRNILEKFKTSKYKEDLEFLYKSALDTVESRLNPELNDMTGQELYEEALELLKTLNADRKPYTIGNREEDRKKFNKLISILESKEDFSIVRDGSELTTNGERLATYLVHRRNFDAMVDFSSTQSYTMNVEALFKGWDEAHSVGDFFNETLVLELLYGQDFKTNHVEFGDNDKLESKYSLEQERIRGVNRILEEACDLFGEDHNSPGEINNGRKRGEFNATGKFEDAEKTKFKTELKKRYKLFLMGTDKYNEWREWRDRIAPLKLEKAEDLSEAEKQDIEDFDDYDEDIDEELDAFKLTPEQEANFDLGLYMMIFLDLRTYYVLPYYIAGVSPVDAMSDTIGHAAQTYLNGKGMYYICGKMNQLVNPALLVSRYSDKVVNSLEAAKKKNNYNFATKIATPAWANWHAPSLDQPDLDEKEKIAFKRKDGALMVPSLSSFWLPHGVGESQKDSPLNPDMRDAILKVAGKEDVKYPRGVALKDLLRGAEAIAKFVEECEAGFQPSGNMRKDAEEEIGRTVTQIAMSISPTKALPTVNKRYLANNLYLFARTSLLSFSKEYGQNLDMETKSRVDKMTDHERYKRTFDTFLENLVSSIKTAPTAGIKIDVSEIPEEFRERYGLRVKKGKVTISEYVTALLPSTEDTIWWDWKALVASRKVDEEVAKLIVKSVQADRLQAESNRLRLRELADQEEPFFVRFGKKCNIQWMSGIRPIPVLRDGSFDDYNPGNTDDPVDTEGPKDFYRAMEIIELTKKKKQAEESKS